MANTATIRGATYLRSIEGPVQIWSLFHLWQLRIIFTLTAKILQVGIENYIWYIEELSCTIIHFKINQRNDLLFKSIILNFNQILPVFLFQVTLQVIIAH